MLNFVNIVNELLLEDITKPFEVLLKNAIQSTYGKVSGSGSVDVNALYQFFKENTLKLTASGGYNVITDSDLKSMRYFFPLLDTGYKILTILGKNEAFKNVCNNKAITSVPGTSTGNLSLESSVNDINKANEINDAIEFLILKGDPSNYSSFVSPRLIKISNDFSQLTVQKYTNLTIVNAIVALAAVRGITNSSLIKKTLYYPLDYLTGNKTITENFDKEIIYIGGKLLSYFIAELEKQPNLSADEIKQIKTTGTSAASNSIYTKKYIDFLEKTKLSELEKIAPEIYTKIKDYTLHIKTGKSKWEKVNDIISAIGKGLSDVSGVLSRF